MTAIETNPPSATKWISIAWHKVRAAPFSFVLMILVYLAIAMFISFPQIFAQVLGILIPKLNLVILILGYVIYFLLYPAIWAGAIFTFIQAARGRKMKAENMFEGFRNFWRVFALYFLYMLAVYFGFLLLIVPGVLIAVGYLFAPNLVVERHMPVFDSFRLSWRITRGYKWQLFLMGLMLGGIGFLLMIPVIAMIAFGIFVGLESSPCLMIPGFFLVLIYSIPVYFLILSLFFLTNAEAYVDLLNHYERSQGQVSGSAEQWYEQTGNEKEENIPVAQPVDK